MTTTATIALAALRTLNERLRQDNDTLTTENQRLRDQLAAARTENQRMRDELAGAEARTTGGRPTPALVTGDPIARSLEAAYGSGREASRAGSGVPLFDRPRSERRFLVGAAREQAAQAAQAARERSDQATREQQQLATPTEPPRRSARRDPGGAPVQRIFAGTVPVRRSQGGEPTPRRPGPRPGFAPDEGPSALATPVPTPPPIARAVTQRPETSRGRDPDGDPDDASRRFSLLELD